MEWALFASCWKSRKLLFMLSTMFRENYCLCFQLCFTELKYYQRRSERLFWANPCLPRLFLACVILECFVNFLDDPYYEPLPWFVFAWSSVTVVKTIIMIECSITSLLWRNNKVVNCYKSFYNYSCFYHWNIWYYPQVHDATELWG